MLKLNEELFAPNSATYYENDPSLESNQTSIHIQIILQGAVDISTLARLDVVARTQVVLVIGCSTSDLDT